VRRLSTALIALLLTVTTGCEARSLLRLRICESHNNYRAVSRTGKYHGAYQFDQRTWNATAKYSKKPHLVGVLPSKATPTDQDHMASALRRSRGSWAAWPHCGRNL